MNTLMRIFLQSAAGGPMGSLLGYQSTFERPGA
jgi:hypothetical protein